MCCLGAAVAKSLPSLFSKNARSFQFHIGTCAYREQDNSEERFEVEQS
jgi:hypothetical protein